MSDDEKRARPLNGELHLMGLADDPGTLPRWFCPDCKVTILETSGVIPQCPECGALPCEGCAFRRFAESVRTVVVSSLRFARDGEQCQTHDWPDDGFAHRLFRATVAGEVISCRECVARAHDESAARAAASLVRKAGPLN